jgi:glucose-1-phosphate thymidylyltransferase
LKGIILAGGSGTRLYPLTMGTSKQLMSVYDKPMVYYPLSVLMLADIRDILIITTPEDQGGFVRLLGDGSHLGLNIHYSVQQKPEGIPQAYLIGREFIGNDSVALILGDNIYYGHGLRDYLHAAVSNDAGATIFAYRVRDPHRYGVLEFDQAGSVVGIEEKPAQPKSSYAKTGLYFTDNRVVDIAAALRPSSRGETEITDLVQVYLESGDLAVQKLNRGIAWLDTGTHESLLAASTFIHVIQERQGLMVACVEEVAFRQGWIGEEDVLRLAEPMKSNGYGRYLTDLVNNPD